MTAPDTLILATADAVDRVTATGQPEALTADAATIAYLAQPLSAVDGIRWRTETLPGGLVRLVLWRTGKRAPRTTPRAAPPRAAPPRTPRDVGQERRRRDVAVRTASPERRRAPGARHQTRTPQIAACAFCGASPETFTTPSLFQVRGGSLNGIGPVVLCERHTQIELTAGADVRPF